MPQRDTESALADAFFDVLGLLYVAKRRDDMKRKRRGDPSWAQDSVLSTLVNRGRMRVTELAAVEDVSAPTMTVCVTRMARLGLLRRYSDSSDKRIVWVEITPSGTQQYLRSTTTVRAALADRLRELTDVERAALSRAVPVMDSVADVRLSPQSRCRDGA